MTPGAPERCDLLIEAGWVVPVEPHGVVLEGHAVRLDRDDPAGLDQQVAAFRRARRHRVT